MDNNHNMGLSEDRGLFYRLCHHRPRDKGLSREDFFTELWAYVLRMHPELLRRILDAMMVNSGDESWTVETQVEYPAASLEGSKMLCRPDLRLGNESARILIEHKIESKQHEESLKTDEGVAQSYNQLTRYLAVDSEALVAFVTVSPQKIDADTLNHPRYRHPEGREHFRWCDFFPIVDRYCRENSSDDRLLAELVVFMKHLHMEPHKEGVGMIPAANSEDMKEARFHHKEWWRMSIKEMNSLGWQCMSWGLDIQFTRPGSRYPSLYFDMRFGEKAGVRDGRLRGRLRVDNFSFDSNTLVKRLREMPLRVSADSKATKTSTVPPIPCIDVSWTMTRTRPEFVGTNDPQEALKDFVLESERLVRPMLGIDG